MTQQNFSHSSMLATAIPTRRSPRAVERLCNGMTPPGMTADQTATLLALAHCTGWSADRIAHKLKDVTDLELSAEVVWSVHDIWVKERGGEHLEADDIEMMHVLLRRTGVDMHSFGVPLNRTEYPKSVKFAECWSPKNAPDCPLFNGFTTEARKRSKSYLSYVERQSAYGKFTPVERELVTQFGSTTALILQDVLKRWARAMRVKLRVEPELRPIRDLEHVCLIIDYLEIFRDSYESKFGKMEESNRGQLGETKDGCVYITSTGYGAKIFLGLMMADRIHVIDRQRRHMREKIGFADLDISTLGDDSKNCPICHDPMSVENPEGIKEDPIELTICCSQVIGRRCLKAWLREFVYGDMLRDTCPICRFKFPETFMEKLFEIGEYKDRLILQHRHESTESG